jgi:hypothetical protein
LANQDEPRKFLRERALALAVCPLAFILNDLQRDPEGTLNKPNNTNHNNSNKRSRGRNSGRRPQNPGNRSFESNGPEVKVRGSASQICDKYLTLARDASSAGDRVRAESLLQHAEHYYRLVNGGDDARTDNNRQAGGARRGRGPGEVAVAGEMQPEEQPQEEQSQEEAKEQRPSRRERARSAGSTGRGRQKVEAGENVSEDGQDEAVVEATVVQVIDASDAASNDDDGAEDEAVVIAEPVQVADPEDDDTPESEVA